MYRKNAVCVCVCERDTKLYLNFVVFSLVSLR